jgi:hypothetical protein
MTDQKGMRKKKNEGLFFLMFFVLSMISSAFGLRGDIFQEEAEKKEEQNQLRVLPFAFYTPETKIAVGVGGMYYLRSLKDPLKGYPSTLFMSAIYTQKKQFIFEITPDLYLNRGKFHLVGYLGFRKYVERFFGIGSQTADEMEEEFSYRSFKFRGSFTKRVTPGLYVGIQYDFEHSRITEVEPGGILDSGEILGMEGGFISGLGILLVQDSRNNIFFPAKGTWLQADMMVFAPALASDYRFRRFTFDFRQYFHVFSEHVLAIQQNVQVTSGDVPFQRLPMLGGHSVMRGIIQGRFRDKNAIFLQMEYRVPLFWRFSAAGFIGYGDVAERLGSFKLNDFKISGGLGIRYQIDSKSGTNVRLDIGFAKGNIGVYAMIRESF